MLRRQLFRLFSAVFRRFYATPVADLIWKIPRSEQLYQLLIGRLKPSSVTVFGHTLALDRNDSLLLSINGVYEETEARLVERCIRPGDVVVDVGAHIGYYTLLAARAAGPAGQVLAFEPERENFALLTANIATNGYTNVQPLNMAVTAQSGAQRLFVSSENAGDHHLYAAGDDRPSYEVEAVSLDDFFAGRPKVVNVIKMDVQGSEPFALQGMREVLEANDSVLLFTELAPKSLSDAGSSAPEYAQALRDAGFDLHVIDEETGTLEPTKVDQLTRTDFRRENHINLLCSKGDAFQERVRASAEPGLIRA